MGLSSWNVAVTHPKRVNECSREERSGSLGQETNDQPPAETHPLYLILAAGLGNKAAAAFQLGLRVSFQPEWNLAPPL